MVWPSLPAPSASWGSLSALGPAGVCPEPATLPPTSGPVPTTDFYSSCPPRPAPPVVWKSFTLQISAPKTRSGQCLCGFPEKEASLITDSTFDLVTAVQQSSPQLPAVKQHPLYDAAGFGRTEDGLSPL